MKQILFFIILILFSASVYSHDPIIIRLKNPTTEELHYFYKNDFNIASYRPGEYLDLVVSKEEFRHLRDRGFDFRIFQTTAGLIANLQPEREIPGYRTYTEALAELQQIEIDHPEICKLFNLGPSRGKQYYDGGNNNYINYQHDIWALKLSADVDEELDKPAIFYMGAHHAREPLSTEVTFYILNHLLDNYGSDSLITGSVHNKEIWFVPIVNPDGHKIVLDQINVWWRKNIRDNDGNGQITPATTWSYPDGVDLNRNYALQWGGQGSSGSYTSQIYRGPSAFSEPEALAMKELMENRHFVAGITYHTYGELVLWPYGYISNAIAPDATALAALGTAMAQATPKLNSGHYTPQPSWQLYPAAGVTDDYAYGEHGIFCYTIELATEFIPPADTVVQVCEDNLEAALILLNRIDHSTLTGHVTDAVSAEPVVAEIYVEGIDNTGLYREPYRSNEEFGRYYRMLPTGNYTVTFTADDYTSQTFSDVNIHNSGRTLLDVALVHQDDNVLSGMVSSGFDTCYEANGTLLVYDFIVQNGATAQLIAGNNATLKSGTAAMQGSYVSVRISDEPCLQPVSTLLARVEAENQVNKHELPGSETFFTIFPNPCNGIFKLKMQNADKTGEIKVGIFNTYGTNLQNHILSAAGTYEFDLTAQPAGIYLVRITDGNRIDVQKLVKH
jgi:carboxypeptidase T